MAAIELIGMQLVFVALSLVAMAAAPLFRGVSGQRYWILLSVAILVGNVGELCQMVAAEPQGQYAAARFTMLGTAAVGVLFLLLVRAALGLFPPRGRCNAALFLVPMLTLVGAFLCPMHQSRSSAEALANAIGLGGIDRELFNGIHLLYAFIMFLAAWVLVARHMEAKRRPRADSPLLLSAVILPVVGVLLEIILADLPFNPTACALAVSMLLLGVYMMRHRGEVPLPPMRGDRIENISDAYLLLDDKGRLVDRNEKACRYFPELCEARVGTPVHSIHNLPPAILKPGLVANEIRLRCGHEEVFLRTSSSVVRMEKGKNYTCVLFYDVTEMHRVMAELGEKANRDALTALYNRIAFRRIATRDLRLAVRSRQPVSVLMLDLDHFKAVNDHYGHQMGDKVLLSVAAALKKRLRGTDVIGRYGGEEFCVFLPDTDRVAAVAIAEVLRGDIEAMQFNLDQKAFSISVSIGVAALAQGEAKTLEELMGEADAYMYRAKGAGRNKVMA